MPRFYMPLELGIFIGAKAFGGREQRRKAAIVLDADRYRYQKFISDIAGQDIRSHGCRTDQAIGEVRAFLSMHAPASVFLPRAEVLVARHGRFRRHFRLTCGELRLDVRRLDFGELTRLIRGWLDTHPLPVNGKAREAAARAA